MTQGIKPLGLKLAQHDVMMSLLSAPQQTQQQLASKSFVTKSHMSAVLTEMELLGWIQRGDNLLDKRSKVICLTTSGMVLAQSAFALQTAVVDGMMSPLSDKQIHELEKISRQAIAALGTIQASLPLVSQ
jgi:DNA-binding MarR family transcriptional regulator